MCSTLHPFPNYASPAYALVTYLPGGSTASHAGHATKRLPPVLKSWRQRRLAPVLTILVNHVQDLASHLFGNPHSQHGWSGNEGSAQAVAEARQLTLQMCNAPLGEYECIFTSGATGAQHGRARSRQIQQLRTTILTHNLCLVGLT